MPARAALPGTPFRHRPGIDDIAAIDDVTTVAAPVIHYFGESRAGALDGALDAISHARHYGHRFFCHRRDAQKACRAFSGHDEKTRLSYASR